MISSHVRATESETECKVSGISSLGKILFSYEYPDWTMITKHLKEENISQAHTLKIKMR
jgi:hypothetical protein